MQSIIALSRQTIAADDARNQTLSDAAKRLVNRLLGCWQHDLSRPFTYRGTTYRVCVKCGMSRQFNLNTWKSDGSFYLPPPTSLTAH
jgi:hypothetical protein